MGQNQYFSFKEFTVHQDLAGGLGMKVCTDACVLGGWSTVSLPERSANRILDIGTGTGLLALMAAQRNPQAEIDAIEIDEDAARQAAINFKQSPFAGQLKIISGDVKEMKTDNPYDIIITNPPFFQQDLLSPNIKINLAKHAVSLSLQSLAETADALLKPDGEWNVLLSVPESHALDVIAKKLGWDVRRSLLLSHQPEMKPFRRLTNYSRSTTDGHSRKIAIEAPETLFIYSQGEKNYTADFQNLLRDFYLAF